MDLVMVALRLAHIGAGVFWVGAAFTIFLSISIGQVARQPRSRSLG